MGDLDGYSRDMLDYTSESNTLMAGAKYTKKDKMEMGLDLSSRDAHRAPPSGGAFLGLGLGTWDLGHGARGLTAGLWAMGYGLSLLRYSKSSGRIPQ